MPSFFLAEIDVLDLEKYQEYIDRASQIVQDFGGEYVFRSDSITSVSGDWMPRRLVLIRFNSKTDDKYLGTWYEIARLDHSFERGRDSVTAEYSLRD